MRITGAALGVALSLAAVHAQQPSPPAGPQARFEVASVKPNRSGDTGGNIRREPGGRVNAVNMPLRVLITFAFQIQPTMLVGAPGWIDSERFDITAKLEGDPNQAEPGLDPLRTAMQALLAERFNLKTRRETREGDTYVLVLARPGGALGPSLKRSTQDCVAMGRGGAPPPPASGGDAVICGITAGPGRIRFGGFPLGMFANTLGGIVGRIVVDRTGLDGTWEFELVFSPEPARGPQPPGAEPPPPVSDAPSIFAALPEQLGLKLEPGRGPVEVLVIDSVARPVSD